MAQISSTLSLTFTNQVLSTGQQAVIAAAVNNALNGYTFSSAWHGDNLDPGGQLPQADTPGPSDVDVTCPVCQAEFKLGAQPL